MTSTARISAWGIGSLAVALLASGCQSHVGTAATVGGERISTDALNTAYKAAALTTSGKAAGSKLQAQVLTQLVQNKQIVALAKSLHVVVAPGDIDATYRQLAATGAANKSDQPDSYWRLNALTQATGVAIMKDLNAKTKKVDAFDLYAVPVKDQATAKTVVGLLAKSPGDGAAIAKKYSTDNGLAASGGEAGIVSAAQLGDPALTTQPLGVATIVPIQQTIYVMRINARLDEADFGTALAAGAKVTVNPRFGTWAESVDSQTGAQSLAVVPVGSDIVAPLPSAAAASGSPSAGVVPSQAPQATAPASQPAPQATAPASEPAPGASASTAVVPSATAAPSATPAPAASS